MIPFDLFDAVQPETESRQSTPTDVLEELSKQAIELYKRRLHSPDAARDGNGSSYKRGGSSLIQMIS